MSHLLLVLPSQNSSEQPQDRGEWGEYQRPSQRCVRYPGESHYPTADRYAICGSGMAVPTVCSLCIHDTNRLPPGTSEVLSLYVEILSDDLKVV